MPMIPAGDLLCDIRALLETRERGPGAACRWPATVTSSFGSAENVLAQRRAVRVFGDGAVDSQDVLTIVGLAQDAERAVWPAEAHGTIGYTILVAAFRVTGLVPGLYLVSGDREAGPFSRMTACPWIGSLRAAYADAACLLLICADISAACEPEAPGYGPLLIRAGTLGYGAWLSAIDLGLAGCVYAGTHHRVTEAARRVDGRSNHIFTTSLGRPHPEGGPSQTRRTPEEGS